MKLSFQEGFVNQKMKNNIVLDIQEDKCLAEDQLTSELTMSLVYDFMISEFVIGLTKRSKDKTNNINMNELECTGIIRLSPLMQKVVKKYSVTRASNPIDMPVETIEMCEGDFGTVLSVKENTFKRGDFQIDLRKCMKKEHGTWVYTKDGVRISVSELIKVKERLETYMQKISDAVAQTRRMLLMATVCLMIQSVEQPEESVCYGCEINHPSQHQHMGVTGCLSEDALDGVKVWKTLIDQQWSLLKLIVSSEDAVILAGKAARMLPDLGGLLMSEHTTMEDPEESEMKTMLLDKDKLVSDPMYTACYKL